ncbi:hypothetical protein [Parafrankia discariae]|uniref:hypothetical protein n=1 Tax=Parafrankia discariae TaxID=365528 RepID=UPI000363EC47|nr:hypothetical protein [Parafrankia discariae]
MTTTHEPVAAPGHAPGVASPRPEAPAAFPTAATAATAPEETTAPERNARREHGDAFDAARLIAYGLRPKLVPARDGAYAELVRRHLRDQEFAALTQAVAGGLGLVVLDVAERAGLVVAGAEDSAFTVRMTDYARRAGGEHRSAERLLHAIAQLAVAAIAFPRPADLLDDSYVGRVSVEGVDAFVREACRLLAERVAADPDAGSDTEADPVDGRRTLEAAWRLYARRPAAGTTRDARRLAGSTTGIIARAMSFLADSGCLVAVSEQAGGTFRTTARYQIQVRELAADAALEELLDLGVVTVADGSGGVRVLEAEPVLPGTEAGRTSGPPHVAPEADDV